MQCVTVPLWLIAANAVLWLITLIGLVVVIFA